MKRIMTSMALALTLIVSGVVAATPASAATLNDRGIAVDNLKRVNLLRSGKKVNQLKESAALSKVATAWSKKMSHDAKLYHNSKVKEQIPANYVTYGENVAYLYGYGSGTAERLHKVWVNSPGHYQNIINPAYNYVGIGVYTDSKGFTWATQVFASYRGINPDSAPPPSTKKSATIKGFTQGMTSKPGNYITWNIQMSHKGHLQQYISGSWKNVRSIPAGSQKMKVQLPKKYGASVKYRLYVPTSKTVYGYTTPTVTVRTANAVKPPKSKPKISNFSKSKTVKAGKTASWAKVKVTHKGYLQQHTSKGWKNIKTLSANKSYTLKLKAGKKNTTKKFRIYVPSKSKNHPATSKTVSLKAKESPKSKPKISNFSKSKTVKAGKTASWAKVKVTHKGYLQQYTSKGWKNIKTLSANKSYTLKLKAGKKNTTKKFRIYVPSKSKNHPATSKTVSLKAK